jgi:hypothetical protein
MLIFLSLPKGNIGLWQEKCQEILFGRKLTGNTMNARIMAGNSEIPINWALK